MTKFSYLIFQIGLFSFIKLGQTGVSLIHNYWHKMVPNYDLSYLEPVDEIHLQSNLTCAEHAGRSNVDVFGYVANQGRCHLYLIDYYVHHAWPVVPGLKFYQKNEEIDTGTCLGMSCYFCMPILETQMTWSEASAACTVMLTRLMELTDDEMHRCVVMQLQYLRKPTTKRYWLGGQYKLIIEDWIWVYSIGGIPNHLWASGEPDNPGTENCVLLVPGGNYTMRSANCSEKHEALCVEFIL